ncbi:BRO family protein [Micromonospora sp. CPCC 206060]|uniref:BRO-N domain-containing protein n=1 Tax=Micromonospora sp. CPCC 206060 TaxID=3122406 RepID=UPI002FF1F08F
MTALAQVFEYGTTQIRILVRDGEPLFSVPDVCRGLEHSNPSVALNLVEEEDRTLIDLRETDSPNLNRTSINPMMWFVTEPGFYTLALASQAPGAKAFRRWITHDVLPQIRKTGTYALEQLTPAEMLLRQAQQLVDQERRIRAVSSGLADVTARVDAIENRTGWWIALAFAKRQGLPTDHSYLLRLGKRAASIARAAGVEPVKTDSVVYGTVNSLPEWAWEQAAGEIA